MLAKGAVAIHIKNNIKSYFNQTSEVEKKAKMKKKQIEDFEKKKTEALMSNPLLSKNFTPNELANLEYEQIREETSQSSSSTTNR